MKCGRDFFVCTHWEIQCFLYIGFLSNKWPIGCKLFLYRNFKAFNKIVQLNPNHLHWFALYIHYSGPGPNMSHKWASSWKAFQENVIYPRWQVDIGISSRFSDFSIIGVVTFQMLPAWSLALFLPRILLQVSCPRGSLLWAPGSTKY